MTAANRVNKPHPCGVHVGLAVTVVSFIDRHRFRSDRDETVSRVCMPAGAGFWLPGISLYLHV